MKEIIDCYSYFNTVLGSRFNPRDWLHDYQNAAPVPMLVLDDFLPEPIWQAAMTECANLPPYVWTQFTRNGSYMHECKTWNSTPMLQTLVNCFNSSAFVTWLEGITLTHHIIPDPHLVGAGLSKCSSGHRLNLHTDFNWNDELQLNRAFSMIWYLHPRWEDSWGGDLEFWDFDRTKCVTRIAPKPNRLLLWAYDDRLIHGYPLPLTCPDDQHRSNLRMFYYQSSGKPINPPHRSLYWWDEQRGVPIDDRTQI